MAFPFSHCTLFRLALFGRKLTSNAGFTAQFVYASQHPPLAASPHEAYEAYIRKKTSCHSQDLRLKVVCLGIFYFFNQNRELQDGQKQEQPLSSPTTDQSCNKQEDEGQSLPTPFPLPHALNTLQF